jgi:hypothetical protein
MNAVFGGESNLTGGVSSPVSQVIKQLTNFKAIVK